MERRRNNIMSYHDYFDFETLKGWTGKYHCHIIQVCKESYPIIHETVKKDLYRTLAYESKYTQEIVKDEFGTVSNITGLKKFVKEYEEYFDYRVMFKHVQVYPDEYVYCMLQPFG